MERLLRDLGIRVSPALRRSWAQMTRAEFSQALARTQRQAHEVRLTKRTPTKGMASWSALEYLFTLMRECQGRVTNADYQNWVAASKEEVQLETHRLQRRRQDIRDLTGFPIPQWRVKRGFYDEATLFHNGGLRDE